jgi:hypothetical protein
LAGWVEAAAQSTTNLDSLFADEPLSGEDSEEEAPKAEQKNFAPSAAAMTQSQPPCTAASPDEDDAQFDELEVMLRFPNKNNKLAPAFT